MHACCPELPSAVYGFTYFTPLIIKDMLGYAVRFPARNCQASHVAAGMPHHCMLCCPLFCVTDARKLAFGFFNACCYPGYRCSLPTIICLETQEHVIVPSPSPFSSHTHLLPAPLQSTSDTRVILLTTIPFACAAAFHMLNGVHSQVGMPDSQTS